MTREENAQRLILVTGATGRQGGAVARHLAQRGFRVRALTRHPQKPAAALLLAQGVAEVVPGDLDDRASLEQALQGCEGVYSVQNFWETGFDREIMQGINVAEAAKAGGVRHLVYSSVASADRNTGLPHFESKWRVEEHIRGQGLPYTILRPVFFMENWRDYARDSILSGTLPQPLDPDRRLQQIAVDDIGLAAAGVFEEPRRWLNRAIDLAGDDLTMTQVADAFSRALGRQVRYVQVPWESFREIAGEEMALMYRWFNQVGYDVDIALLRQDFPELTTFDRWLSTQDWISASARGPGISTAA